MISSKVNSSSKIYSDYSWLKNIYFLLIQNVLWWRSIQMILHPQFIGREILINDILLFYNCKSKNAKEVWKRNIHPLYSLEHSFDIYLKRQKFIPQVFYFKVIYSQLFNLLFYGINYFKLSKYLLQNSKYFIFKEIYFKVFTQVKILAKVLFKLANG